MTQPALTLSTIRILTEARAEIPRIVKAMQGEFVPDAKTLLEIMREKQRIRAKRKERGAA